MKPPQAVGPAFDSTDMPFTKHPFTYDVNRLFLRVGLALQSWLLALPRVPDEDERHDVEHRLARFFGLEEAVASGLLASFHFHWTKEGHLETIHLVPHDRVRRTPGLGRIRELFFPHPKVNGRPPGRGRKESAAVTQPVDPPPAPPNVARERRRGRPRKHPRGFDQVPLLAVPLPVEPHALVLGEVPLLASREAAKRDRLFPRVCRGPLCPFARHCPYAAPDYVFAGYRCPQEALEVVRQHALLVQDLEVSPGDRAGAARVRNLVQLDLQLRHLDRRLCVEGIFVPEVVGVVERTGVPVTQLGPHPLLELQDQLLGRRTRLLREMTKALDARIAGQPRPLDLLALFTGTGG